MKQYPGISHALVVRTQVQGAPTADGDGTAMSTFDRAEPGPTKRTRRFMIRVDISNAGTSCVLSLYVKDSVITAGTGKWGQPIDASGNAGVLANGNALNANASYYFVFEDVGYFDEICLVQSSDVGGTPVATATITEIVEFQELQ